MVKIRDNVNKIELESFLLEKGFYQRDGQWRKFGHFKISKNGHIIPLMVVEIDDLILYMR